MSKSITFAALPVNMKNFKLLLTSISPEYSVCVRGRHAVGKSEGVYQAAQEMRSEIYKDPEMCKMAIKEFGGKIKTPNGWVTEWSYDLGIPVLERRLSQMTEGDIVGLPFMKGEDTFDKNGHKVTQASTSFKPPVISTAATSTGTSTRSCRCWSSSAASRRSSSSSASSSSSPRRASASSSATFDFGEFFASPRWRPTSEHNPTYGVLALIAGTASVTGLAMLVAVPFSLGAAIYIGEFATGKTREILKVLVELLAAIPSVVWGFIGLIIMNPLIIDLFDVPVGLNVLNAGIILGLMAAPIMTTIAEDALKAVPDTLPRGGRGHGRHPLAGDLPGRAAGGQERPGGGGAARRRPRLRRDHGGADGQRPLDQPADQRLRLGARADRDHRRRAGRDRRRLGPLPGAVHPRHLPLRRHLRHQPHRRPGRPRHPKKQS